MYQKWSSICKILRTVFVTEQSQRSIFVKIYHNDDDNDNAENFTSSLSLTNILLSDYMDPNGIL